MAKIPTDLQIFEALYKEYCGDFQTRSKTERNGQAMIYVPVDLEETAKKLETNAHELFGRLYYHLDHQYRYKQDNGAMVHLFSLAIGDERHCINFPYLAGLLADYRVKDRRSRWALALSIISIIIAAIALLAQFVGGGANAA